MVTTENKLLTMGQAAKRLGVSQNTLRTWANDGLIRVVKLPSGHRRFETTVIEQKRREMGFTSEEHAFEEALKKHYQEWSKDRWEEQRKAIDEMCQKAREEDPTDDCEEWRRDLLNDARYELFKEWRDEEREFRASYVHGVAR